MSISGSEDTTRGPGGEDAARERQQDEVNAYFDSNARYWDTIYRGGDLQDLIYQRRQDAVLAYVDSSALAPEAEVLEIGCGTGHLTTELAARAARVQAVDASEGMVKATAERVAASGIADRVSVAQADAHALHYADGRFALVVAVGVLPWLHSPETAVAEMVRVLEPGGRLVLTADNRARLTSFTDPRRLLGMSATLRRAYRALRGVDLRDPSRLDRPAQVDRMLAAQGLQLLAHRTVGFGPLSFMGRSVLTGAAGVRIDRSLQALADRGTPLARTTGWHYLVNARKPA